MGLTSLLIRHLRDRRAAEEDVRLAKEAEKERAEARAHREYLKEQGKQEEPMTPEQFRAMVDPSKFRRTLNQSLTAPKTGR